MTPQQKDFILGALRVGEHQLKLELAIAYKYGDEDADIEYGEKIHKIRAAIKELEAMPTEEV